MPRLFLIVFIYLSSASLVFSQDNWNTAKGTHFIVYYNQADPTFIEKLITKAEEHYDKIADDLGFRRYNFWLWDKRAKIYVYNDARGYQAATGEPEWSMGATISRSKVIHTFLGAQGFFERILPHELGHIIFREFVGFNNRAIPLWLDEGVASHQEQKTSSLNRALVKEAIKKGTCMDLKQLASFNPHSSGDNNKVSLFYAESVSIVDYLIREFGRENFVFFCQNLRDKEDLEQALRRVYPFDSLEKLDRAWQENLKDA